MIGSRKLSYDTASTRRTETTDGSKSSGPQDTSSNPSRGDTRPNLLGSVRPKSLRDLAREASQGSSNRYQQMLQAREKHSVRARGLKVLSKSARANRNLPTPPGARPIFGMSSSNHKQVSSNHSNPSTYKLSFSVDDSDDQDSGDSDEEFGQDAAPRIVQNKPSILRKSKLRATGAKRINPDGSITVGLLPYTMDSVDENKALVDTEMGPLRAAKPRTKRPGLELSESEHSMRGWTQSFRWVPSRPEGATIPNGVHDRRFSLRRSDSNRSILTADWVGDHEPLCKQILRYLRILPPHDD